MSTLLSISPSEFDAKALALWKHQFEHNAVYGKFCRLLGKTTDNVHSIADVPFLPVEVFKKHEVKTGDWVSEVIFTSSTTTGGTPSSHHVRSLDHYQRIYTAGFEREYGALKNWTVLALLPNYLEREGSSLVEMARGMIEQSNDPRSGFYLYNHQELVEVLKVLRSEQKPTLLIGVTFALLDLATEMAKGKWELDGAMNFPQMRIMETGGMKGRRKELIRAEVHAHLKLAFPQSPVDSEYGMTELLSQAYLKNSGLFECPPWMRIYTRDAADPLSAPQRNNSRGALNVIDLANEDSCAFLALSDQGRVFENGTFEVYGRLDQSEIRGCNLMVSL